MLTPLVLPERLVVALIILPVDIHVCQQVRLAVGVEDGSDVSVLARRVTVGFIGAVAAVWPKAMDCPRISKAWKC
jgi:hypothetical protein